VSRISTWCCDSFYFPAFLRKLFRFLPDLLVFGSSREYLWTSSSRTNLINSYTRNVRSLEARFVHLLCLGSATFFPETGIEVTKSAIHVCLDRTTAPVFQFSRHVSFVLYYLIRALVHSFIVLGLSLWKPSSFMPFSLLSHPKVLVAYVGYQTVCTGTKSIVTSSKTKLRIPFFDMM